MSEQASVDQHERNNSNKRVYTPKEIKEILGASRTTIYRLIESNEFHSVRIGNQYRISKKSFDKWLEENNGK